MRKHLEFSGQRSDERGVALILTLSIITLVTLLLIAFAVSMRVENAASKNFNDLIKARELAQAAVDQAVATIRQATTRNVPPANILNYVTFPGAVYYFDGTTTTRKPLYSQTAVGAISTAADPDPFDMNDAVNNGLWITGKGGEFPVGIASRFQVGWVYIAENGFLAPPNPVPLAKTLVGRFAFWVDDEASKININAAWARGAANLSVVPDAYSSANAAYGNTSEIDLSQLLPGLNGFVPAIQLRQTTLGYETIEEVKIADPSDPDFTANRFSLTTYSNDANYPNYIDELDFFGRKRLRIDNRNITPDIDGTADGAYTRLADPNLMKVSSAGGSVNAFEQKYNAKGLKQIIANIIAYQQVSTVDPPDAKDGNPPSYLGLGKTPYVNEVKVTYSHNAVSGDATRTVEVELFYPYGADTSTYTVGSESIIINNLPGFLGFPTTPVTIPVTLGDTFSGNPTSATAYHKYAAPPDTVNIASPSGSAPVQPVIANYFRGVSRLDCAVVPLPASGVIASGGTVWQGSEANDPCVNELTTDWVGYNGPSIGTLGGKNSAYLPPDTSKMVIRTTPMQSLGEIGFIHRPDAPWVYLTLQPGGGAGAGQIPDWAILDIFTIPNPKPMGRMNVNSVINPEAPDPTTARLVPLTALLKGLTGLPAGIYGDARTDTYGMKQTSGTFGVFDTIGEVCEINSLMPVGPATEANKEASIRRIANLITVRSNTFTIWVIAQSIKEPTGVPGQTIGTFQPGTDLITGEVRMQVVVERFENPIGTPKFRVKYFRYL